MNSYVAEWQQRWLASQALLPWGRVSSWRLNNKHYCTWLCRNKAMHKASHLLTLNLCVCVCVCRYVWVLECVPSTVYQCLWGESACRGVSGGLRYSACCQHRHISPSAPLHRYANPASSECRAPDQLQFIPFCSLPLSALTLPLCFALLSVSLHPPLLFFSLSCLHSVFGFLFGLSCSVHGICPHWGIVWRWEDFYWAAFKSGLSAKRCSILSV